MFTVASAVCSHRRHDATRQFRLVGGVYWALVCGLVKRDARRSVPHVRPIAGMYNVYRPDPVGAPTRRPCTAAPTAIATDVVSRGVDDDI